MKNSAKDLYFREKYGPYALVAGGSDGLGRAFAQALAKRKLNLILIARGKERLETAAGHLREQYSVDVLTFAIDLADYEKTKALAETFLSVFAKEAEDDFLFTEQPDWRSGFAQCEYMLFPGRAPAAKLAWVYLTMAQCALRPSRQASQHRPQSPRAARLFP